MPAFTLDTEIQTHLIPGYITPFMQVVGYNSLRDRVASLRKRMQADGYAYALLAERHALELEVWEVVQRYRTYGRLPRSVIQGALNRGSFRAYDFMVLLAQVYRHLNAAGRARLEGSVQHAFTDENDLASLAQEMSIVGNLTRFGCSVQCHDMETGGGFDFLATREGIEFEVEAKVISPDKGRQIHQYDALVFAESFSPQLDWQSFVEKKQGALVRVHVPARINRHPAALKAMGQAVVETLHTGAPQVTNLCETELIPFNVAGSAFDAGKSMDLQAIRKHVHDVGGVNDERILVRAKPGHAALLVTLQSRKPDKFLAYAYESLKDGAGQLSGTRPGILIATFGDVSGDELVDLARNDPKNGFRQITTRLFRSDARKHIHAIHYLGQLEYNFTPGGAIGATGPVYRFFNEKNENAGDARLRMDPH